MKCLLDIYKSNEIVTEIINGSAITELFMNKEVMSQYLIDEFEPIYVVNDNLEEALLNIFNIIINEKDEDVWTKILEQIKTTTGTIINNIEDGLTSEGINQLSVIYKSIIANFVTINPIFKHFTKSPIIKEIIIG